MIGRNSSSGSANVAAWTAGNSSVCIRRRIVSVRPRSTLVGLLIFLEKQKGGRHLVLAKHLPRRHVRAAGYEFMFDALHPGDEEVGGDEPGVRDPEKPPNPELSRGPGSNDGSPFSLLPEQS